LVGLTVRENENLTPGDTAVGLGKAKPTKDITKKDVEGVFVVGADNKVSFKPVKVGIAGEKHFEVVGGLKEGDKIVAGTYQAIRELKDGARPIDAGDFPSDAPRDQGWKNRQGHLRGRERLLQESCFLS
jgi:HlyD family secretion protein